MIHTVTTLTATRDYDSGGLHMQREPWAPPAFAMLLHVLDIQAKSAEVMTFPGLTEWAARRNVEMMKACV